MLRPELARQFGARRLCRPRQGPPVRCAQSAGLSRPTTSSNSTCPMLDDGDVNARVWMRIREVEQSLALIEQILLQLPGGPIRTATRAQRTGKAAKAWVLPKAFRGDVLAWVRIDGNGRVARCHLRDPSWFQWPLLEAAIEGNIVADFPLCNKSFNCSYSGHDL